MSQIIIHKAHQPDIVLDFFDADGLAAFFKEPLKHSESELFAGRRKGFTAEQKPAGMIVVPVACCCSVVGISYGEINP